LDADADSDSVSSVGSGDSMTGSAGFVTNAAGRMMTPGYVDRRILVVVATPEV